MKRFTDGFARASHAANMRTETLWADLAAFAVAFASLAVLAFVLQAFVH